MTREAAERALNGTQAKTMRLLCEGRITPDEALKIIKETA